MVDDALYEILSFGREFSQNRLKANSMVRPSVHEGISSGVTYFIVRARPFASRHGR
jgi:hypothetical protein